jgi:Tol biopolymer transport system component
MTARDDLDAVLDAFFAEGPGQIADDVIETSLRLIDTTDQRRAGFGPRRTRSMSTLSRFALAAAAVVAVSVVGAVLLPGLGRNPGASPLPSDAPSGALSGTASQPAPSIGITPASSRPEASHQTGLLAPFGYPAGGTIVFARTSPGGGSDTSTWRIRPDGSGETALRVGTGWGGTTSLPGTGCCAVLSPDGTQVAVGYDEVNTDRSPGVSTAGRILNLDGSHADDPVQTQTNLGLLIPEVCGGCVSIMDIQYVPGAWSADGSLIATEVWSDGDPTKDGINVAPVGQRRDWDTQVTGPHRDVPVAFSPDGSELLFVRLTVDRSGTLMMMSVDQSKGIKTFGTPRAVSPPGVRVVADGYFGPAASWSPDSGRITYAATDATGSTAAMSVTVVDADGGDATVIAGPGSFITSARWSPDGRWIAFDRATNGSIHDEFIVAPDGTALTNLTESLAAGVCCGRWSPDSTALLVAGTGSTNDQSNLLIIPVDGSPIAQVTNSPSFYTDFSWGATSVP